jgi:hypothetical protein
MHRWLKIATIAMVMLALSAAAYGQEITREQIKGLDEQVQEIKSDVLAIAAELNQLEEKLLYPSNTQIAVFVSLADGKPFRLDSVRIEMAGTPVAHHIYTFKELEALQKGGVQRIYTGNVRSGQHQLVVSVAGKSAGGSHFTSTENFRVTKAVGPAFVEIVLTDRGIALKEG